MWCCAGFELWEGLKQREQGARLLFVVFLRLRKNATLGDDDQEPQARPTQANWETATADADIAVDPGLEWSAIHYTVESAVGDPRTTNWRHRWTTEMEQLSGTALDDTPTPQTTEPAKRATQTCLSTTRHTVWHYPTTIHPEAVSQIKVALSLDFPDTHNAHQPGSFTAYWSFPTAAGMVAQVAEPTLPPSVTAVAKAVQAMACSEGASLEWTPNTLVEQRVHDNANKTQQTGRQIHPPLWDKDGNLQPHSPWMVHFVLEDHNANRKDTEVQLTHNLAHTHLQYTVPTSNALVTYGTSQQSMHRLHWDTEGTTYTVYTWAQYSDLPCPTWHPNPAWHQPLQGKGVPKQGGTKPAGSTAQGDGTAPANIVNSALANARMPLIHTGHPIPDNATHHRTWGTIRRALHHDIDGYQATLLNQGSATI